MSWKELPSNSDDSLISAPTPPDVPGDDPGTRSYWSKRKPGRLGFTLIELVIVATIMGVLAGIAVPNYTRVLERVRITRAIGDIDAIGRSLSEYFELNGTYPGSLADLGPVPIDPWGNPYEYLRVEGASRGQLRKDRFLVPVNSDFDLYSMGPDGLSVAPFTAAQSRDDIVRANDGGYVGLADNY